MPYRVTPVGDRELNDVSEFVGDRSFLVHQHNHPPVVVVGTGVLDAAGTGVRFYQKDDGHEGRDVRVWHIHATADHQFSAQHEAAI